MQRLRIPHSAFVILLFAVLFSLSGRAATTNYVGGPLAASTAWSNTVVVVSSVTVPSGLTLTVLSGTEVRMSNGVSLTAQSGGAIDIQGDATNQVLFAPFNGNTGWGNIAASGAGSSITVRHAEVSRGGINFGGSSTGLVEDCYVHDVTSAIVANSAGNGGPAPAVTVRRVHVNNYSETIYNNTLVLVEDCLLENLTASSSDALELQGAPTGCVVRRCTLRNGSGSNTDAFDCNGSRNVFIHDCLIYNFTDKGISFGSASAGGATSTGMTVSNCVIYGVNIGVALKDGATASLYNNTIVDSVNGLSFYQKFSGMGPGRCTNGWNNILFNNVTNVGLYNGATLTNIYSDIQGTNWPGVGNISADPLFVNAAAHEYRLETNSPARGTARNGLDMGALLPVGVYMASSEPAFLSVVKNAGALELNFWADGARTYSVQASDSLTTPVWSKVADVATNLVPRLITVTNGTSSQGQFFRIVTPRQP